jgi:hypothetical protein
MLTPAQKILRLQDCIALLEDVDAMQQVALGDTDVARDGHERIRALIEDFEADIAEFAEEEIKP